MASSLLRFSPSLLPVSVPPPSSSSSSAHPKPLLSLSILRSSSALPSAIAISQTLNRKAPSPIAVSATQTLRASSPNSPIARIPSPIVAETLISVAKALVTLSITLAKSVSQTLGPSRQTQHGQVVRTDDSSSSLAAAASAAAESEQIKALRRELCMAAATGMPLLCFAAISTNSVNTPLTVVASGMAKWLELYSGVLMVRVLLSWFPNIPWERQPLQAIRDMCDPYLNLFRNIVPPLFNALDVSPLLAFLVLGLLASILNTTIQS